MFRNAVIGAIVFGLTAALAGYLWLALEFPWVIVIPAALGWYAVVREPYGQRKALISAAVGGVLFTVVLIMAMYLAISDDVSIALPAWIGPVAAGALAGAIVGAVIGRARGASTVALFAGASMAVAVALAEVARNVQPASVQQEGAAQSLWVAGVLLVVGLVLGAACGAAVVQVRGTGTADTSAEPSPPTDLAERA